MADPNSLGGPPQGGLNASNIPLVGSFFSNPAGQSKVDEFYNDAAMLNAYRPERAQGMLAGLSNRSTAYQGAMNALASMYGSANAQPPSQLLSNPMSGSMLGTNGDVNAQGSPVNNAGMLAGLNRARNGPVSYPTGGQAPQTQLPGTDNGRFAVSVVPPGRM